MCSNKRGRVWNLNLTVCENQRLWLQSRYAAPYNFEYVWVIEISNMPNLQKGGIKMPKKRMEIEKRVPSTRVVSEEIFKQVYDSPRSLPGKDRWVTIDKDVRIIERLLGMDRIRSVRRCGSAEIPGTA